MLLNYDDLAASLAEAGVPVARERLADDASAAAAAAGELAGPAVLKLVSPELVHKSDAGAVLLDIRGAEAAAVAAARLEALAAELSLKRWQILVQEMVDLSGPEVFVGLKRDAVFGPIVVVGAGGRMVELLPDRAIAACPIDAPDAAELLRETTVGRMLSGYRGGRDVVDEVAQVVAAASRLPDLVPGLVEADLNPVVVAENGPVAVDARIVVGDEAAPLPERAPVPDLARLLEPESVVVLGASASGTVLPGNRVLGYLKDHGYGGRVAVVHPKAAEVDGFPAVASIADVPFPVELACVAVPAASCLDVIEECGAAGVPAAVVLSSGFSEIGERDLEQRLVAAAAKTGMVLCGPNTVGVMSPGEHVHVCFSQAQDMARIPDGGVALVAQSGALGGSLSSQAWERGIGISRFVSVGNQGALSVTDYLEYLSTDEKTSTIAVVLEGVTDGRALLAAVQRAKQAGKAVVVLKIGRSDVGARAVQSHTGSLAGDYAVYRALLERSGAVPVDSVTELLDTLELREKASPVPPGARVGVVSTSGGACSMIADLCTQQGFAVPVFSDSLQSALDEVLPGFAAIANPVDVTGQVTRDFGIYGRTLELILASDEVDVVAVMVTTVADPMAEELAREIVRQVEATAKPVLVSWTIAKELAPRGLGLLREAGIPVFDDPARALRAAELAR
ncbi:hypothetical protein DMP23_16700 [Amycolatopsis sp. A1MSW2902]|uniref:acetate--CoA ligase family protein n=1 Tax=Amycolatopsis sp. A1MSW2902 TaxID=687413 RepID=UPI00307CEB60